MIELENVACPYCRRYETKPWANENGYTAVKCINCGFVFVNPRPLPESIDKAVQLGIHQTETRVLNIVGRFKKSKIKIFKKRLLELYPDSSLRGKKVRCLDIGSGFGELLLALKEITDKRSIIQGIEPCKAKLEKARKLGLNVNENLDDIDLKYNFISLINVFSHLPDPISFIYDIKQKLTSNGEIFLVTGNGGDIPPDKYPGSYYLPDHLVFAGEKHIIGIFKCVGFEVIKINRYKEFLPENMLIGLTKHIVKRVIGLPSKYSLLSKYNGPFRSLWIRACLCD